MIVHHRIFADLDPEEPSELAKPINDPSPAVALITPRVPVGAAEERSSHTASDAMINADTNFIDDVAACTGRHKRLQNRASAPGEGRVFTITVMDKIPIRAALSSVPRKNLGKAGCFLGARQRDVPKAFVRRRCRSRRGRATIDGSRMVGVWLPSARSSSRRCAGYSKDRSPSSRASLFGATGLSPRSRIAMTCRSRR